MRLETTDIEFNKYITALGENTSTPYTYLALRLVLTGNLWTSESFSNVSEGLKAYLVRRAFQYIAKTTSKGTLEIDKLADLLDFRGYTSFSEDVDEISFTYNGEKIFAVIENNTCNFFNKKHELIKSVPFKEEEITLSNLVNIFER